MEWIDQIRMAIEKLTEWDSSKKAFGHFETIDENAETTGKNDRLYEFWCLMKILEDLSNNYNISVVPYDRSDHKIFPQSPAPKKRWSYFRIDSKENPGNGYQICYGTKIKLSYAPQTTFAADISVQRQDSTEDPDEEMVELIMDAKYKYRTDDTISFDLINDFMQRVHALNTADAEYTELNFNQLHYLKSNCLLTNGKGLPRHETYCIRYKIKQVERFDIGSGGNVIG